MENRIELERRGRQPAEISELNLDNCRAKTIAGLTDEYKTLESLSMINVGLTSLEGLPSLPSLKRLDISENRISSLEDLKSCLSLTHLNLASNKIKDIESLEPLKELKDLMLLDLFNCEVTNGETYRTDVFKVLPHLKWLDGFDINNVEQELSDDENDLPEGGEDSDEEEIGAEDEEAEELGLAYLDSSRALQDEDETEDFAPDEEDSNEAEEAERGEKRKRENEDEEEEEDN